MAKLKLPFELEKPSANEFVTQSSEIGHKGHSAEEVIDNLRSIVQNVNGDTLYITDKNGNVVGQFDSEGLKVVDVKTKISGSFVSLVTLLYNKVDKVVGKGLSTEDYTTEEKNKLASLSALEGFVSEGEEDTFYIADSNYNVVAKIDNTGLKTIGIKTQQLNESKLDRYKDAFYITDKDGYVALSVDKDGVHISKLNSDAILKNTWQGKVIATYGDSITAINNGNWQFPFVVSGYNWGNEVAKFFAFSKHYGRGIGSTCFKYRTSGGQIAWCNTETGEYVGRNDSYTYDNYEGHVTIPDNCTPIRGDGSSWLRITTMFPENIRNTIDVILVMYHNDYNQDMNTDVEWIPNDTTDPEWAASAYYSAWGGDYNISTVKGGIASVVMKLQALMPQAMIILMTPIGGVYDSHGVNTGDFDNATTAKMKKLADTVLDVAQRMNTPCINVYGNCGINTLNRSTYIADNIHPYTEAGRKKVGRAVISGLMGQVASL